MNGELHIVPDGHDALLGLLRIPKLGINLQQMDTDRKIVSQSLSVNSTVSLNDTFKEFAAFFKETIGLFSKFRSYNNAQKPRLFSNERETFLMPYTSVQMNN